MHRIFWLCIILVLFFGRVRAQQLSEEALFEKFSLYSKANPSNILFVHTDKTVYTNNETIWFSGYMVKSDVVNLKEHTILSVAIMREDNREIFMQDKYLMQNGLSFGSMSLPDSIPPGNYQFIASTNILDKNNKPFAVFTQSITIKSITQTNFKTTITLLDTVVVNNMVRAKVSIEVKDPIPKQKVTVKYSVSKGTIREVDLEDNSAIISIPSKDLGQSEPTLLTSVRYNKEVQYLSLKLPVIESEQLNVRFYPEGGHLANELESKVGWEAKTSRDLPVSLTGVLYENALPIDTLSTNSYGIGSFKLQPNIRSRYTLRVAANPYLKKDTVYNLPPILENGISLHLENAVINDTLRLKVSSRKLKKLHVLVHNYREAFASFEITANPAGSQAIVVLPAIPKGIGIITVLDTLERPLAERLFIARFNEKVTAQILTDKSAYSRKDSVHVQVKLTNKDGNPVQGIVSIAAVQDNRIEGSKQQDIESYVYLNHDLGNLPINPHGRRFPDKDYMENIILVKGWRKYTWQNLINVSPKDTVLQTLSPFITGNVSYNGRALKKPVTISIIRDSLFDFITSESDGSFVLADEKLFTIEGRKVFIMVNLKQPDPAYNIAIIDPFIPVNQKTGNGIPLPVTGFTKSINTNNDLQLGGMEKVIALREVIVSANKGDDLLYGTRGSNACGDYVCRYGILNCNNHPNESDNTHPLQGKSYFRSNSTGKVTYMGCLRKDALSPRGIYLLREFYGVNGDASGILETQFLSTLFWAPGIIVNTNRERNFSFFTGDITGKFRIVVQGISEKDMIYGEADFMIK